MKHKKIFIFSAAILSVGTIGFLASRQAATHKSDSGSKLTNSVTTAYPAAAPESAVSLTNQSQGSGGTIPALTHSPSAATANASQSSLVPGSGQPTEQLKAVQSVLKKFYKDTGSYPIGLDHADIVAQLRGKNPKQKVYLPDGPSLKEGQLFDQWGTPVFFHTIGVTRMSIASLGPDKSLGTADDLWAYSDGGMLTGVELEQRGKNGKFFGELGGDAGAQ